MRYIKLTAVFLFMVINHDFAQSPTNMFRGTGTHIPVAGHTANDCFDQLSWKYNAGAAIRSTPVADKDNIYFGTEKGRSFLCEPVYRNY